MNVFHVLASAFAVTLAAGNAHANVIAVSLDNVNDYAITGPTTGVLFSPNSSTSSDSASFNGPGPSNSVTCPLQAAPPCNPGGLSANAPQATAGPGPFPAEDTFTKPPAGGFVGSRGDANVRSIDFNGPNAAGASNVAESRLNSPSTGGASGTNLIVTNLTLGQSIALTFTFVADPYMQVAVDAAGDTAAAILGARISLVDATGTVFLWTPGRSFGQIGVASETDPFSLNQTLTASTPAANQIFSPIVGPATAFDGTTGVLAAGDYTLSFEMTETVRTACGTPGGEGGPNTGICATAVPEPATLALLGLAFAGMGLTRRHRLRACESTSEVPTSR